MDHFSHLPQELIDSVVDAILDDVDLSQNPWIINKTPGVLETLRSCALVASAFVRPCQMYIFYGLAVDENSRNRPESFSALFSASPHLAPYVRALFFLAIPRQVEENCESIPPFIACLTNLVRLDIRAPSLMDGWKEYPALARASFSSAFSLPSMKHVRIGPIRFENLSELDALLSASTGLKTLELRYITVKNTHSASSLSAMSSVAAAPRIVLESLHVYSINPGEFLAMLPIDSFTVLDITRLRSLRLKRTLMKPLVQLNASTVQHLEVVAPYPSTCVNYLLRARTDERRRRRVLCRC
jgi:hypothetical protein